MFSLVVAAANTGFHEYCMGSSDVVIVGSSVEVGLTEAKTRFVPVVRGLGGKRELRSRLMGGTVRRDDA